MRSTAVNHEQDGTAAAAQRLRRTGSGRRAAHAAAERTAMQYLRPQRESTSNDSSRPASPWSASAATASGSALSSGNTKGGGGSRGSRKSKSASAGDPSWTAATASSSASGRNAVKPPSRCPLDGTIDADVKIPGRRQYKIRPPTPTRQDPPSPSPPPSEGLRTPPTWLLKQFGRVLDGIPSPPPKYARSILSMSGHLSSAPKFEPSSPTRSLWHPSSSSLASSPPPATAVDAPNLQRAQQTTQPPPDLITSAPSVQSPTRRPPPAVDPPSPRQLVKSLARQSDTEGGHWSPVKSAPSAPRPSLFDLTAYASQPHIVSRAEVIDLSDGDDDGQDVETDGAKVSEPRGPHHSGAADQKCEVVDVIDSDDSASDDESVCRPGRRVLVNGLFDSPELDLKSGDGQDDGDGEALEDVDSPCASHRSFATSNQHIAPALFSAGDSSSHRPHSPSPSTHTEPAHTRSSLSFIGAVPHNALPQPSSSPPRFPAPPPPQPQRSPTPRQSPTPSVPPSTKAAPSLHSLPILRADSDSDIEFMGETTITSPAAPAPHPPSQPSSRSNTRAPISPTAAPPPPQLAQIFNPRKSNTTAPRSSRAASRTSSGGPSPTTSTRARTPRAAALAPVAGPSSDDDDIVCIEPAPTKSPHVSAAAHAHAGGDVRSGPSGQETTPRSSRRGSRHSSRASSLPPSAARAGDTHSRRSRPSSSASSRAPSPSLSVHSPLRPEKAAAYVAGSSSDEDMIGGVDSTSPARANGDESSLGGGAEQNRGTLQQCKRKLDERMRDGEGSDSDVIVLGDSEGDLESSKRRKIG